MELRRLVGAVFSHHMALFLAPHDVIPVYCRFMTAHMHQNVSYSELSWPHDLIWAQQIRLIPHWQAMFLRPS
jgi:hypothetical protein